MNFHDAALDLEGLQQQLSSIREDVCITAVTAAKDLCEKLGIRVEGRIRRRKQMPGENARDAGLSAVEEITRIMKSVIDRLIQEITTRFGRLKTLDEKFGFLFDINKLFASDTSDDIRQHCATLADFYETDIDGTELFAEISDCNMLLKSRPDAAPRSPLALLYEFSSTRIMIFIFYVQKMFSSLPPSPPQNPPRHTTSQLRKVRSSRL
jgi:hypothetical protein